MHVQHDVVARHVHMYKQAPPPDTFFKTGSQSVQFRSVCDALNLGKVRVACPHCDRQIPIRLKSARYTTGLLILSHYCRTEKVSW